MAKVRERKEAIELRIKERLSIGEICVRLGVAKSSVSEWIRNYPLTEEEIRKKCGQITKPRILKCKICEIGFSTFNKRRIFCSNKCRNKFKFRKRISLGEAVVYWRQKVKKKAIEFKGGKCIVCNYDKCIRAMKFHHLDPTQKEFGISGVTRAWDVISKELEKCILVCGNCHDEIHEGLIDVKKYSRETERLQ